MALKAKTDHWTVFKGLVPFIWPVGRPDLRFEVVIAFVVLVLAKLVTVAVPIVFKMATDALAPGGTGHGGSIGAETIAFGVTALIVAYGVGRVLMMALNQIRDVLFTKVGQNAVRHINLRTFQHLHTLSLRFHLERRTGGLSRIIERGTRGVDLILRMGILQLAPTVLELLLVCGLLVYYFNWTYVAIVLATVAVYLWFTFAASERRIAIRREMNDSDTDTNTKAIDSLLNFETVKYFGNEDVEAKRLDASMARYEKAAVKTYYSLGTLNSGQSLIFTTGMTIVMWLTARGVSTGTYTLGDFVMINAMMIQL
ncbi:MAG: ABC transporter transmembrane domain-containing protein, partial [Gammaproteobacteria bacterium]